MAKLKKAKTKEEYLFGNTKTIETYYFRDIEKGIDQLSKKIYKIGKKIIHYPIGFEGGQRFNNIIKFEFIGFEEKKIPIGVYKSANFGYGFTKILRPLAEFLDNDDFKVKTIRIVKKGKNSFDSTKGIVCFTESTIVNLYKVFKNHFDKHKKETRQLANKRLNRMFSKNIKAVQDEYTKNSLYSFVDRWKEFKEEFSAQDVGSIIELIGEVSKNKEILKSAVLLKSREVLEEHFIEDVIAEFKEIIKQKTETKGLEKRWQLFLKTHSWIFSYVFSYPVILIEDEAYVGGKHISNKDGKVTDFLFKNDLTNNVAFVEIKTHKTKLIRKGDAYRGTDVCAMSKDLSGGINQVLNQRDNFQKEFYALKGKSRLEIETFNSKCVVLMGRISELKEKELKSFELFRSNSKDVEIVTFDELLARAESIQKLMQKKH